MHCNKTKISCGLLLCRCSLSVFKQPSATFVPTIFRKVDFQSHPAKKMQLTHLCVSCSLWWLKIHLLTVSQVLDTGPETFMFVKIHKVKAEKSFCWHLFIDWRRENQLCVKLQVPSHTAESDPVSSFKLIGPWTWLEVEAVEITLKHFLLHWINSHRYSQTVEVFFLLRFERISVRKTHLNNFDLKN